MVSWANQQVKKDDEGNILGCYKGWKAPRGKEYRTKERQWHARPLPAPTSVFLWKAANLDMLQCLPERAVDQDFIWWLILSWAQGRPGALPGASSLDP